MDRRGFLKGLAGSGAVGLVPGSVLAGAPVGNRRFAAPMFIVAQAGLPAAEALARSVAERLQATGERTTTVVARADELGSYAGVAAILEQMGRGRLIGVMDDASALIFQQIAAARGAGCLIEGRHRHAGGEVRHCCSVAGLDADIAWTDARDAHAQRVGDLFARALGQGGAADAATAAAPADRPSALSSGASSVVSFALSV